MVLSSLSFVVISIFDKVLFHALRASLRTPSKSQSGISASTFLRAPSISTADIPTFTNTCSSFAVLKCSSALQVGSNLPPSSSAIESVTSV